MQIVSKFHVPIFHSFREIRRQRAWWSRHHPFYLWCRATWVGSHSLRFARNYIEEELLMTSHTVQSDTEQKRTSPRECDHQRQNTKTFENVPRGQEDRVKKKSSVRKIYAEKTRFPFPFTLNGIRSWWRISFRFWTEWNSIRFKIERKTVTTIISQSIWKEMET